MSLTTISGLNPAGSSSDAVQPSGLYEFSDGDAFIAGDQNKDLQDLQELGRQAQLAGVHVAATITASGLTLNFPAGFQYFARQIYLMSGTTTFAVPDGSISYVWGCVDGILRRTANTTPPASFDATTACILVKATASAGVVTLDATVQQKSRYADPAARKVKDGPLTLDYANNVVDASGGALKVPVLASDPATPVDGMVWINSATSKLKFRVGGATIALP